MRVRLKALFLLSAGVLLTSISSSAHCQISLPSFGQKNAGSNDQKANALLHQHLPLDLDANSAYPTVPNEDLLGGPFRGRVLPITLDTLTKPLPPGDYVLPMTFFCSEYSIHRPGAGTAYVLAPAKGTAAKAISTLLWRGMLTGHKPQDLQSVSWAIQGSVPYDKMPANYKRLVDELIPDMKNQVNGQAFADIEDGFQGKVNRFTRKVSDKATEGLGKVTGGRGRVDIKVDVELNESFQRLGRLGKMALDGESINTIVTDATLTDDQRTKALYAGQGTQAPPLSAANGPWSVMVPGVAYMRFIVHSGNLQGDNVMQIRIFKPRNSTAMLGTRPHLVLAQYPQSTPSSPSLLGLVNGTVDQAALSQCLATSTPQSMCVKGSIDVSGLAAYSVATGTQSPLVTAASPLTSSTGSSKVCVKKALYEPTLLSKNNDNEIIGLCIYLAAVSDVSGSCGDDTQTAYISQDEKLNWVQTYKTNADGNAENPGCTPNTPHKDHCTRQGDLDVKLYGPLYRPDRDPEPSPAGQNYLYTGGFQFNNWKSALHQEGTLQLLFRDFPNRNFQNKGANGPLRYCTRAENVGKPTCVYRWHTAEEESYNPTHYEDPVPSSSIGYSKGTTDNDLRLVSYPTIDGDPDHFDYSPLIKVEYGFRIDWGKAQVVVDPLVIAGHTVDNGGFISLSHLTSVTGRPSACTMIRADELNAPPSMFSPFPYDSR